MVSPPVVLPAASQISPRYSWLLLVLQTSPEVHPQPAASPAPSAPRHPFDKVVLLDTFSGRTGLHGEDGGNGDRCAGRGLEVEALRPDVHRLRPVPGPSLPPSDAAQVDVAHWRGDAGRAGGREKTTHDDGRPATLRASGDGERRREGVRKDPPHRGFVIRALRDGEKG